MMVNWRSLGTLATPPQALAISSDMAETPIRRDECFEHRARSRLPRLQ